MSWKVRLHSKAKKQYKGLKLDIRSSMNMLIKEVELLGPIRGNWKSYGKLGPNQHHCHLKSGRPTYVVCWKAFKEQKLVEVYYVGTHEKAPY